MIRTHQELMGIYKDYSNPKMKINRLVKNKNLIKIATNVYEDEKLMDPYFYSPVICFPSYISFDYALYLYGMIPERAFNVTSATYKKNKHKEFKGTFCYYYYQDIPSDVYPKEVLFNNDVKNYPYMIASREKALLDKLYTIKGINTLKGIKDLLFEDLRINEFIFYELDSQKLINLSKLYNTITLKTFSKYIEKEKLHGKFLH